MNTHENFTNQEADHIYQSAVDLRKILWDDANPMTQGAMMGSPIECFGFATWWIQREKGLPVEVPGDYNPFSQEKPKETKRLEKLESALKLALVYLDVKNPSDGRVIPDEFIAMASILVGCDNNKAMEMITERLDHHQKAAADDTELCDCSQWARTGDTLDNNNGKHHPNCDKVM